MLSSKEKSVELLQEIEVLMAQHKIKRYEIADRLDYNRRSLYVWFNHPDRHYSKLLMVRNKINQIVEEKKCR